MASAHPQFSGGLVPAIGPDGAIKWQAWTYSELLDHLNTDLDHPLTDTTGLGILPAASVTISAASFSIPNAVTTPIAWDNTGWRLGGMLTSASGIKVPLPGIYHVDFKSTWNSFASPSGQRQWLLTVNGAAAVSSGTSDAASTEANMTVSVDLNLAAGDLINVSLLQSSGAAVAIAGAGQWTWMFAHYVTRRS